MNCIASLCVCVQLTPPNPIIEANAGFHGEMSMEKGVNQTFEQELAWSVDNEIEVPSGHVTKADLVIKVTGAVQAQVDKKKNNDRFFSLSP